MEMHAPLGGGLDDPFHGAFGFADGILSFKSGDDADGDDSSGSFGGMAGFDEWSPGTDESVMEVPSAETSPSPEALDTREPHERPPSVPRATTTSGRVDKSQRKLNHNISEKKRQRTISQYIDELRSLIPTCDETYITKTTILQRCVTHVSHLKHELAIVRAENARLVQTLQSAMTYTTPDGAAPIIGPSRTFALMIHRADAPTEAPHRLDLEADSLRSLHSQVAQAMGIESARMQLFYHDPEFENELVQLVDLRPLRPKARLLVYSSSENANIHMDGDAATIDDASSSRVAPADVAAEASAVVVSAPSSAGKDAVRLFAVLLFTVGMMWLPVTRGTDELLNQFTTSRSLFAAIELPSSAARTDFSIYLLLRHMLFVVQLCAWFLVVRIVLFSREAAPRLGADGVNVPLAQSLRKAGQLAYAQGHMDDAKAAFLGALRALGHDVGPRYRSRARAAIFLVYQVMTQHLHRYAFGQVVDSRVVHLRRGHVVMAELARLHHGLYLLHAFHEQEALLATMAIYTAVNYADNANGNRGRRALGPEDVSEIYNDMAFALFKLFPLGITLFIGAPGVYYKEVAMKLGRRAGTRQLWTLSKINMQHERSEHPFKPLYGSLLFILAISLYEYMTGFPAVSVFITAYVLFELCLFIGKSLGVCRAFFQLQTHIDSEVACVATKLSGTADSIGLPGLASHLNEFARSSYDQVETF